VNGQPTIAWDDAAWIANADQGALLEDLLGIDSPSGDEDVLTDWLGRWISARVPDAELASLGSSLIAVRGRPQTAVFAHTDTTGYTLGYEGRLIPIGGPNPSESDRLWMAGNRGLTGTLVPGDEPRSWRLAGADAVPGTRWVYAAEPLFEDGEIFSPYLDNRAGVWAALQVLLRNQNVAIAFTSGEEHNSVGARVCARYLYERLGIAQALISDITWDTDHIHVGQGPAVSLRDRNVPRQRFLSRVIEIAGESKLPHQREIESEGGSDANGIQQSGCPVDWVFVGAPERDPHTARESLSIADLNVMADLLTVLVTQL
jgi:putative aminopeptidase FrvX